ncbi:MAG: hypothetical protein KC766_07890, partial [Myxococcales bacterium]|nr:hypothetical protein [Myxococcales bacterium]
MRALAKTALVGLTLGFAPLVLTAWVGARLVDAAGDLGQKLADWQPRSAPRLAPEALANEARPADTSGVDLEVDPPGELTEERGSPSAAAAPRSPAARAGQTSTGSRLRGIRIRKAKVLALSRSAGIPGGSFVPATAQRPAGLLLSGVGGLGVGVQDGDVLTTAAGQPVRSVAQVIGLVAGARHARAPAISGTLYRGAHRIQLNVEMPYIERRHRARRQAVSRSADGSAAPAGTGTARPARRPGREPRVASSKGRRDGPVRV